MKFSLTIAVVASLAQGSSAFAPGASVGRKASFLSMNVENVATKDVRVGVIGAGRIGIVHLEAITKAPGVTPIIISNPTVSKAENGTLA